MQGTRSFEGQGIIPRAISTVWGQGVGAHGWGLGLMHSTQAVLHTRTPHPALRPPSSPPLPLIPQTLGPLLSDPGASAQAAGAGVGVRPGGLLHRGVQRAAARPAGRHRQPPRGWQDPRCALGWWDGGGVWVGKRPAGMCSLQPAAPHLLPAATLPQSALLPFTLICPAKPPCAENNAIQHQPNGGHTLVLGAARVGIESEQDAEVVTRRAAAARAVEATAMNAVSSRSHSGELDGHECLYIAAYLSHGLPPALLSHPDALVPPAPLPPSLHAVHHWAARGQRHGAAGQPQPG